MATVDTCRRGVINDLTSPIVAEMLVAAASSTRCKAVITQTDCRTFSAAHHQPDAQSRRAVSLYIDSMLERYEIGTDPPLDTFDHGLLYAVRWARALNT